MRSTFLIALLPVLAACASSAPVARAAPDAPARRPALESRTIHATSNPIVSDGSYYTTDPAPLVVGDTLYILTGRDTASPGVNDFHMPEWQMLVTSSDPMEGRWTHYPHFLRPEEVFRWAAPGRAYAAQIVRAPNGRFYIYAPVVYAAATTRDKFAIGVAVSDTPLGPWVDAHPEGPIVSQSYPVPNDIQNIDPTVLVDHDGRVYLYWGTFGRMKGVELEQDMMTFKGTPIDVHTLHGFFEASWLFEREHRRADVGVYGSDLLRVHSVRHGAYAAGTVDLPRRHPRSGLVDHFASGDRGVRWQVVHRLPHRGCEERWALPALRGDRPARVG
jgi:hypothetical protein